MKAVLFDFDGVIFDSTELHFEVWQRVWTEVLNINGSEITREIFLEKMFGHPLSQAARNGLGRDISESTRQQLRETYKRIFRERAEEGHLSAVAGVGDFIREVEHSDLPHAIATSIMPEVFDIVMPQLGFGDELPDVFFSERVPRGKPAPDVYLAAAEHVKQDPADCLVLEDSPAGIRSALAAGCVVWAIETSLPQKRLLELFPGDTLLGVSRDFTTITLDSLTQAFSQYGTSTV